MDLQVTSLWEGLFRTVLLHHVFQNFNASLSTLTFIVKNKKFKKKLNKLFSFLNCTLKFEIFFISKPNTETAHPKLTKRTRLAVPSSSIPLIYRQRFLYV